ncbi:MAG: transcriptional repressor NrdR [Clostridia bacterium]|nr:transcriptional repressor NrdR [Clostridia bacterium]
MRCQVCNCLESRVIDSRPTEEGNCIRRRRECTRCGRRFTTYEKVEQLPLMVIKRDGSREPFEPQKIRAGILHACGKLPVSAQQMQEIADRVEQAAYNSGDAEISSQRIGDMVMAELKQVNDVAYVRFAAVYRKFTDLTTFMSELQKLVEENQTNPAADDKQGE